MKWKTWVDYDGYSTLVSRRLCPDSICLSMQGERIRGNWCSTITNHTQTGRDSDVCRLEETQEQQTWQQQYNTTYFPSVSLLCVKEEALRKLQDRHDDSLMFSAAAAAPACLQERVGCVHVRYLFVELLQLRVNAILVSLLDAPDNPVQVQVHTSCTLRETWITFQVVSRHKGFTLVVTPDPHDHHLPHCSW